MYLKLENQGNDELDLKRIGFNFIDFYEEQLGKYLLTYEVSDIFKLKCGLDIDTANYIDAVLQLQPGSTYKNQNQFKLQACTLKLFFKYVMRPIVRMIEA